MIPRLAASAFGLIVVIAIVFLVALQSRGADYTGDWLLEDLTCAELQEAYSFGRVLLDQHIHTFNECLAYAQSPADAGYGLLHCAVLKKDGKFVQGLVNDIASVYNAKIECTSDK